MSKKLLVALSLTASFIGAAVAHASGHDHHGHEPMVKAMTPELVVQMVDLNTNKPIGTIGITETAYGVVFTPNIKDASIKSAGMHGFHMHTNPSCAPSKNDQGKEVLGGGAGGHFDPAKTNSHGHPWTDNNHLGDLPAIYLSNKGEANTPVLAPRLKMADLPGHSLMIHVGGDNYSNKPTLGGGGARMLCGVIKESAGMGAKAGMKK